MALAEPRSSHGRMRQALRSGLAGSLVGALLLVGGCGSSGSGEGADWQRATAHYYPDDEIAKDNVKKLGVAWEFSDFVVRGRTHRGMESTPIVANGVMYVTGPWSVVYALDPKTGKSLWTYDPDVDGQYARRACCDAVNRGVAVDAKTVYVATLDGFLAAVDAKTGKQLWKSDTFTDRSASYTITGAPVIAGDVVIIGNAGAELGVRGYISAYNRKTGKFAWRFYLVPGDPKKGPDEHPEVTLARKTWDPQSRWDLGGGGTAWDNMVYDPDTDTVFIGTGNGMPHPRWSRSPKGGDNLFLSSIVALSPSTGRMKWYYQTTPGDSWDFTATQNMILADLEIDGRQRKVVMQAPKNGFFYVLDRVTGAFISGKNYTTVTWASGIDQKTGRPIVSDQGDFSKGPKLVWPSEAGGHNWQPMAYSEKTKLVYIPVLQAPMTFRLNPQPYKPYSVIMGTAASFAALDGSASDPARKGLLNGQPTPRFDAVLTAWDPVKQKAVWTSQPQPFWHGGTMTTSGGLVFQGGADGVLTAYDAATGAVLHRIDIGTGIMSSPMSYTIDGVQYVAVAAGFGGALNSDYPAGSAARKYDNHERLIVFKLGGEAVHMPPARQMLPYTTAPSQFRGDAASVARGATLFYGSCAGCHGGSDTLSGYPNLWKMTPETHSAFKEIVLNGAFSSAGMASFKDVLSEKDADDIHAFLSEPLVKEAKQAKQKHGMH